MVVRLLGLFFIFTSLNFFYSPPPYVSSVSRWFSDTTTKVSKISVRKVWRWPSISIFTLTLLSTLASIFASLLPPSVSWVLHPLMSKFLEQVWRDPYVFFVRLCCATLSHFHFNVVRIGFDRHFLVATFRLLGLTYANGRHPPLLCCSQTPPSPCRLRLHRQPYRPHTRCLPRSCKLQLCLPLRHPMF